MKRASLSALPARPKAAPADLTDRLLAREAAPRPETVPNAAPEPVSLAPAPAKRAARKRPPPAAETAPVETAAPAQLHASDVAEVTLEQALEQAKAAAQALTLAARGAPARYELALRYRLEALAHHVQQVTDFIHGRTRS